MKYIFVLVCCSLLFVGNVAFGSSDKSSLPHISFPPLSSSSHSSSPSSSNHSPPSGGSSSSHSSNSNGGCPPGQTLSLQNTCVNGNPPPNNPPTCPPGETLDLNGICSTSGTLGGTGGSNTQPQQFVCSDGSIVSDPSQCPISQPSDSSSSSGGGSSHSSHTHTHTSHALKNTFARSVESCVNNSMSKTLTDIGSLTKTNLLEDLNSTLVTCLTTHPETATNNNILNILK